MIFCPKKQLVDSMRVAFRELAILPSNPGRGKNPPGYLIQINYPIQSNLLVHVNLTVNYPRLRSPGVERPGLSPIPRLVRASGDVPQLPQFHLGSLQGAFMVPSSLDI